MRILALLLCSMLAACAVAPPAPSVPAVRWEQRVAALQTLDYWQLDGRVAAAVGNQGWQATLNWREQGADAEVHLAGPLGIGSLVLKRSERGLSLNGAPPSPAVVGDLESRLGFALPLDHLRYWLLGVPDPAAAFELARNAQDRAAHLAQDGWRVDYERYMAATADILPGLLVLSREGARVRIAVDRWTVTP